MFWIYFGISPAASHYHRIEENIWTGWSAFLKNGYNWEIFLISSGSSAGQLYLLVPKIWMSPVLMWKHLGNTFLTFFILWKCLGNIVYLLSIGPLHVNLLKSWIIFWDVTIYLQQEPRKPLMMISDIVCVSWVCKKKRPQTIELVSAITLDFLGKITFSKKSLFSGDWRHPLPLAYNWFWQLV